MAMIAKSKKSTYSEDLTRSNLDRTSECRLFRAVILQAASDAVYGNDSEKLELAEWIHSQDFEDVCFLSAANHIYVKEIFFNIMKAEKQIVARYWGRQLTKAFEAVDDISKEKDCHLYSMEDPV